VNRRRVLAGALALAGLAAGVLVALLGWSEAARQPAPFEWVLQLIVLLAAIAVVARVVTHRKA
jgi:hypothetical protein